MRSGKERMRFDRERGAGVQLVERNGKYWQKHVVLPI